MTTNTSLIDRYVDRLLAWRGPVLVGVFILIFAAAAGLPGLYLEADYRSLFKEGNQNLIEYTSIEDQFTRADNVVIVLEDSRGIYSRETLAAISDVTARAWTLPYATRVDSLSNYQHTRVDGDDLAVVGLVPTIDELSPEAIAEIQRIAGSQVEVANRLASKDGTLAIVNITLTMPYENAHAEAFSVMKAARELRGEFSVLYPEIRFELVGMAAFNHALVESSEQDAAFTMPAMFGVITLLLILLLRSIRATALTLTVAILSALVAMGVAGWMRVGITPPTGMTPNIILIVAVANCVHLFISFLRLEKSGVDRRESIRGTMSKNCVPILLTNLSTAIGFMSMGFSESPPFADLGILVAVGLAGTAMFTLVFVPIMLSWLPARTRSGSSMTSDGANGWLTFTRAVTRFPRATALGAIAIALVAGNLAVSNELNDNVVEYLSEGNAFRQAAELTDEKLGGTYSIDMAIHAGGTSQAVTPEFLNQLDQFAGWLREQPQVLSVDALSDTVKRINMTLHGNEGSSYAIPNNSTELAQYLLLYELSLPAGLELTDRLNFNRSAARVRIALPSMSTKEMLGFEQQIRSWMGEYMPSSAFELSRPTIMFAHMGEINTRSSLLGTLVAVFLIALVLSAALRSVRLGAISLVPNLIPAAVGFGIWALLFGYIGMSIAMVAGMTLGIVVDDTVHFLSRYLVARRQGADSVASIAKAFADVGRALITSTIILTCGFVMLMLSDFRLNSDMGLMTAIIVCSALLFDLFLLPSLLVLIDRRDYPRSSNVPGVLHKPTPQNSI